MRITAWTVCALLPLLCASAPAEEAPLRVLLVTGGHGYDETAFGEMLAALDGVEFRQVAHPAPEAQALPAPEHADEYDVIVLYDSWQEIGEEAQAGLLALVEGGKGLVVLHHALCDYDLWPAWHAVVGGHYYLAEATVEGETRPASTYREGVDIDVEIADPEHPITRGLKPFTLHDEVYGSVWISPDAHPLLTTDHPESTRTIAWWKTYGEARIVGLQLGHGPEAFADPTYRELVRRSALWAAGALE